MTGRCARALSLVYVLLAFVFAQGAFSRAALGAEPPPVDEPGEPSNPESGSAGVPIVVRDLEVMFAPIFGDLTIHSGYWSELVVKVANRGKLPRHGKVAVIDRQLDHLHGPSDRGSVQAPFEVSSSRSCRRAARRPRFSCGPKMTDC
ncbi:MAG: hypothetical protein FJ096_08045 [Deltaproteobacteria bacterium]|nr:hypothetical protein [Deltaproteobacteria bacterium]